MAEALPNSISGQVVAISSHGWVEFTNFNNRSREHLKFALLQTERNGGQKLARAILYDRSKEKKLTVGAQVKIFNFAQREETKEIIITHKSRVMGGKTEVVPSHQKVEAEAFIDKPVTAYATVEQIMSSPQKKMLSFRGEVISGDMPSPGKPRELVVKETTSPQKISCVLWQESSTIPINIGDEIELKDVTVRYNTFSKQNQLSANRVDEVKVIQPEKEDKVLYVTMIDEENDGEHVMLLDESTGEEIFYKIKQDLLHAFVNADNIYDILPVYLSVSVKKNLVVEILEPKEGPLHHEDDQSDDHDPLL